MSARHIGASCLIHIGYKCSSKSPLPVLHIAEIHSIDPSKLTSSLSDLGSKVFVLGSSESNIENLSIFLRNQGKIISNKEDADSVVFIGNGCSPSRLVEAPEQNVFILNESGCSLLNSYQFISRRFHFISMVAEAQVFGVIISSLMVYNRIEKKLKGLLGRYSKVMYPIYLGKINPLKLGNFKEIDLFVMVACENANLPDNKEFYKPVISLFELEVGLKDSWQGRYSTIFEGEEGNFEEMNGVENRFGMREFKGLEVENQGSVDVQEGYSGIPMCYKSELNND
jgi:diphthamide biosynthesis protein 2